MSNMSYCRFRNTSSDLSDCIEALQYGDTGSSEECAAGARMFREFLDYCEDEGIIDGYNKSRIDGIFATKDEDDDDE